MARVVTFLLLSIVGWANCLDSRLFTLSLEFVKFLGDQNSKWNNSLNNDRRCLEQLEEFANGLETDEMWALNFFDSWGKIPAGVLFGNSYEVGNYDQCRRARHRTIAGQHCTLEVDVTGVALLDVDLITYGICVPAVCRPQVVKGIANEFLKSRGMRVTNDLDLGCFKDEEKPLSALAIVTIVLFSCYAFILLLATVVGMVFNGYHEDVPPGIKRFSIYTNLKKIFNVTPKSTSKSETMDCINGVRSLSMMLIIVHHVHDVTGQKPTVNGVMLDEYLNSYLGVSLHKLSEMAVDTFLMLSGMLVAMKVLRELDQDNKLDVIRLYLHRIVRIVPAYAAMLLFTIAFTAYFADRNIYEAISKSMQPCYKDWWKSLLFIHNFNHPEMCFPHTWYISADMQLYILSPLLLIPLWKFGRRFTGLIVLLAFLSISWVFTTFIINDFRLYNPNGDGRLRASTYFPTYARMSVWLFGLLFGYYLHQTRFTILKLSKTLQIVGWTTTIATFLAIGYATKKVHTVDSESTPAIVDAFYESLHRSFWVLALMWTIFACINGYGGLVNQFLSWTCWQPWAKLSYTMYLVHIWVQLVTVTMHVTVPVYFTVAGVFQAIFGLIGYSAAVAVVWSVAFEYPFIGLDKVVLKRLK